MFQIEALMPKPNGQGKVPEADMPENSILGLIGKVLLRLPRWMTTILEGYIVIAGAILLITTCAFAINLALGGGYLKVGWFELGINRIVPESAPKRPEDEIDWQQKSFTATLMMSADPPEIAEVEEYIKDCYPSFRTGGKNSQIINGTEAGQIAKDKELPKKITIHLDRLEGLAAAYTYGVVNPTMFAEAYKDGMAIWYMRYQQALAVFKTDCGCTWTAFECLNDLTGRVLSLRGSTRLSPQEVVHRVRIDLFSDVWSSLRSLHEGAQRLRSRPACS
jgi:hypothetical protein